MNISWICYLGWRQMRFHWRQTALAAVGIAVAVLVLLVVLAFAEGIQDFMADKVLQLTPHLTLEAGIQSYVSEEYQAIIADVPGVEAVGPYLAFPGLIQKGLAAENVSFQAVDWRLEDRLHGLQGLLVKGSWSDIVNSPGLLIGSELARRLTAEPGDLVEVVSPEERTTLPISGIFYTGFYGTDASLVLLPLDIGQLLLGTDQISGFGVRIAQLDLVDDWILPLQEATGGLWVRPWYQRQPSLFISMRIQRYVLLWIIGFVFLVATFGTANVFVIRLLQQERVSGILRAIGAAPRHIFLLFIFQGLLCGVVGSSIGWLLARVVISWLAHYPIRLPEVFYMETLPIVWPASYVIWAVAAALLSSLLAVLYPALRFSRLDPAEVINRG